MKLIPDFIKNTTDIVSYCNHLSDKFVRREGMDAHESIIPNLYSRFSTLKNDNMPDELIDMIFSKSMFDPFLKDCFQFIQIQRYSPGDFIAPHKDVYSITKLHLISLTSSVVDGLVCVENDKLIKVYDQAGQYIDFPYDAIHWVDPVKTLRYSLVIGE